MRAVANGINPQAGHLDRTSRMWLLVVVGLLSSVTPLGTDMYLPAFPAMARQLGTTTSGIQTTLTTFMIGLTIGQLVWGPVSDHYGRRRPLLAGTALATVTTFACAAAPTLGVLIGLRLVQGISCAAGLVLGRAVISDIASGRFAARMFGILMTLVSVAPILAPLLGGAIFTALGWRWVFTTLAILMAAMLISVAAGIPETNPRQNRWTGQSAAIPRAGRTVLAHRPYLGYALAFAFAYSGLFCYISGSSFVYQNVLDLSPGENTVAFTGTAALVTITSGISAKLVTVIHPHRLLRAGLLIMAAAAAVLSFLTVTTGITLTSTLSLLSVFFLALGFVVPNATALALAQVPHAAGTGSAVLGALQTGLAAGIAPLIGLAGSHTATPMLAGMTAATAAALLTLRLTRHSDEK